MAVKGIAIVAALAVLVVGSPSTRAQAGKKSLGAAAVERLNYYRKIAGVPPVTLDSRLSRGCQLHADYLRQNPQDGKGAAAYTESSKNKGYTAAGKKAAERSIFSAGAYGGAGLVDYFMSCFFQRRPLLDARLRKIGVGATALKNGTLFVVDVLDRDERREAKSYPVLYPIPDQKDIPLVFSQGIGDRPDPRQNPLVQAGYPITISPPATGWHPENVSATFFTENEIVPVWVYSKDAPPFPGAQVISDVLILPKAPLLPGKTYTVHVSLNKITKNGTAVWEKRWSFTTARAEAETGRDYAAKWRDAVVERLNAHRIGAGLPAVSQDTELSLGCQLHAEYVRRNPETRGAASHTEEEGRPGYSDRGKKSAARSVVQRNRPCSDPARQVDSLIATFYHRLSLLHPRTRKVGVGVARWKETGLVSVIDAESRTGKRSDEPILYPYPGQTEVPLLFALGGTEWPDPRPDKKAKAGYPITFIATHCWWKPGEATATLTADGKSVPCWVFTKEKPALEDWPEPGVVCLLPKQPLKPSTTYTVSVRCRKHGLERAPAYEKTWSFTTAAEAARR